MLVSSWSAIRKPREDANLGLVSRRTDPWEILYFKLYKSQIPQEAAQLRYG